jgi:hypothetical protein
MLRVRIKMRSGAYASLRSDTDYTGEEGVGRSFEPGSVTRGPACLTSVCVQGDMKAVIYSQADRVVETTSFALRDV